MGAGDSGRMGLSGRSECPGPRGPYISDLAEASGGRTVNYDGTLAETFSCIADVGIDGCGFEQPLEAIRLALDGNPENAGFLRDHAYLAIIVITDEDDCSAADPRMFDPSPATLDSALGPFTSFRCFEFGVECDGDDPRRPGEKRGCRPRGSSPYLRPVAGYTEFLQSLKPFPQQLVLATISGPLDPVAVEIVYDDVQRQDVAELVKSCDNRHGEAVPPIRLTAALSATGAQLSQTTICNEDLTDTVARLADFLGEIAAPCLRGDLADVDPSTSALEPECTVTELSFDESGRQVDRAVPLCDDARSNLPCYSLDADPQCDTHSGLALALHYPAGYTPPPLTRARAACRGH
jgi:hypothetical protein